MMMSMITLCRAPGSKNNQSFLRSHQYYHMELHIATGIQTKRATGYYLAKNDKHPTCTATRVLMKFHISSVFQNFPLSLALVRY